MVNYLQHSMKQDFSIATLLTFWAESFVVGDSPVLCKDTK